MLTQNPTKGVGFHRPSDEEVDMTDEERYEAIFFVFGEEGIEAI